MPGQGRHVIQRGQTGFLWTSASNAAYRLGSFRHERLSPLSAPRSFTPPPLSRRWLWTGG
jgi:hypothetical protein